MTNFNERTISLLYKNIPLKLYSRKGDVSCLWEVSWRRGQTATYWPKVLLTIAALFFHLGLVVQPWVTEGLKPHVCRWLSTLASYPQLTPTPTDSSCLCPAYIFVWRPPASAVLPLIYTGASLDWRLGRVSICYNING